MYSKKYCPWKYQQDSFYFHFYFGFWKTFHITYISVILILQHVVHWIYIINIQPKNVAKLRLGEFTPHYITDQNPKLPLKIAFSNKYSEKHSGSCSASFCTSLPLFFSFPSLTYTCTHIWYLHTHLWHTHSLTFYPPHEHNIHTNTDTFECINPCPSFGYFCAHQHGGKRMCVCAHGFWDVALGWQWATERSGCHSKSPISVVRNSRPHSSASVFKTRPEDETKWWKTKSLKEMFVLMWKSGHYRLTPPCQWKLIWSSHNHWTFSNLATALPYPLCFQTGGLLLNLFRWICLSLSTCYTYVYILYTQLLYECSQIPKGPPW